jgi:hypothetical protein
MVSESEGEENIAGITTKKILPVKFRNKSEYAIFFAGYDLSLEKDETGKEFLQHLNFYVTQEGHLYANEGYFKGIIEASKIIGHGENYALEIIGGTDRAFRFSDTELVEDSNMGIEYLSFQRTGSYFYNNNNTKQLMAILHNENEIGIGMF